MIFDDKLKSHGLVDDEILNTPPMALTDIYAVRPVFKETVDYPEFDPLMASLRANMYQAVGINPDVYREAQKRALEIGVPTFALMDIPELDDNKYTLTDYYLEDLSRTTPALANGLAKNIDLAIASIDNIDDMRSYAMELAAIANSPVLPYASSRTPTPVDPFLRYQGISRDDWDAEYAGNMLRYAWHSYWMRYHGTKQGTIGGAMLERMGGTNTTPPDIAYDIISPIMSNFSGGHIENMTPEKRLKWHAEKSEYHASQLRDFDPNFLEKMTISPFGYFGQRTAWREDSLSWAAWGTLVGGVLAAAGLIYLTGGLAAPVLLGAGAGSLGIPLTVGTGMAVGMSAGTVAGRFNAMRLSEYYGNVRDAYLKTDIYGNPLPMDEIRKHAWLASYFQGATEYISDVVFMASFPSKWKPLAWLSRGIADEPAKIFAKTTFGKILMKRGGGWILGVASEMAEEVVQGGIWEMWSRILRNRSDQVFIENSLRDDMMAGPWQEGKEAFFSFALPMLLGTGGQFYHDMVNYNNSMRVYTALMNVHEKYKNKTEPKGIERSPGSINTVMQETAKNSGIGPVVYVSREAFRKYFQNKGLDPVQAATELGHDVVTQFLQDLPPDDDTVARKADKADLEIPAGAFAEHVVRSEHFEELGKDIKDSPESLSVREYEALEAKMQEDIKQVDAEIRDNVGLRHELYEKARLILTEADERANPKESEQTRLERIDAQAQIMARAVFTLHKRFLDPTKITPQEFLDRVTVDISRKTGPIEIDDVLSDAEKGLKSLARGAIAFNNVTGQAVITLFKGHDASTIIHEFMGHFYLETLLRAEAMNELNALGQHDLDVLQRWVGVEAGGEFSVGHKEKIASAVEQYFMEGKAPSVELSGVFERLKKFFLDIYQAIRFSRVELNDEVRAVFDSWLATDSEMEDLRSLSAYESFRENADKLGVTQEEADQVLKKMADAIRDETESVAQRVVKPIVTRIKGIADKRADLEKDARETLSSLPVYIARKHLFSIKEGMKVWRGEIIQALGPEALEVFRGAYVNDQEKSVPLATVADVAGYGSDAEAVADMYRDLATHPKLSKAVRMAVDKHIDREVQTGLHGEGYRAMLEESRHSDNALMVLAMESLLTGGEKTNVTKEALMRVKNLKDFTNRTILHRKMNDVSIRKFLAQERQHARAYEKALFDNDLVLAVRHKDLQMLNHAFALSAMELQRDIQRAMKVINKYRKRGRKTFGFPQEVLNGIDALVGNIDMRKVSESEREIISIIEKEVAETGAEMPAETTKTLFQRDISTMEVGEVIDIADSVARLAAEGRRVNRLLGAEKQQFLDEARDSMIARTQTEYPGRNRHQVEIIKTMVSKAKTRVGRYLWGHTNMDFMCKTLDNGPHGPYREMLFMPIERGVGRMMLMDHDAAKVFKELADKHGIDLKKLKANRISIDLLSKIQPLSLENLITIALYYGSSEGRQRLLNGYNLSDADVEAILSHLTPNELDFVNSMWKWLDTYFEPANEVFMKAFGEQMKRIAPLPYRVGDRYMDGGYFPIYYDNELSTTPTQGRSSEHYRETHGFLSMASNYTEVRAKYMPPRARMSLFMIQSLTRHLTDIHTDIALKLPIMDVRNLLNDQMLRDEMIRVIGPDAVKMMLPWLEYVEYGADPPVSAISRFARHARKAGTVVGLAFRWSPAVAQVLGFLPAAVEIGPMRVASSILNFYGQPHRWKEMIDFVHENSPFMKFRRSTLDMNLSQMAKKLIDGDKLDTARDMGFYFIGLMDASVTIPVWLEAYHMKYDELGHQGAAGYADQVIRQTNNVGRAIDMAQFQRGSELHSLLTMFYSFMGNLNRMGQYELGKAIHDRDLGRAAAFLLWGIMIPAIALGLIRGNVPEPEEYEDMTWFSWARWAAKQSTLYYLGSWVGIRDLIGPISGYPYSLTPAGTGLGNIAWSINSLYKAFTKEGYLDEKWPSVGKGLVKSLEFGLATSLYEPYRQLKYLWDTQFDDEAFEWRKLLFNVPPK